MCVLRRLLRPSLWPLRQGLQGGLPHLRTLPPVLLRLGHRCRWADQSDSSSGGPSYRAADHWSDGAIQGADQQSGEKRQGRQGDRAKQDRFREAGERPRPDLSDHVSNYMETSRSNLQFASISHCVPSGVVSFLNGNLSTTQEDLNHVNDGANTTETNLDVLTEEANKLEQHVQMLIQQVHNIKNANIHGEKKNFLIISLCLVTLMFNRFQKDLL